ncbi:MAG: alcohol dehydrogenase catalytic domain-containing protein [Actinomycetota bacterium]|nr:alcohol dehydrogenase catalytic domain-containing protein [Actinomycetota bacterium]
MGMRAAVTRRPGVLELATVDEPAGPGPGEVLVRPELVGVCGSDLHLFRGHLPVTPKGKESLYPVVQGHEVCAVVEALGEGAGAGGLSVGDRVALWPLTSCGECYPCRSGRAAVCDAFELIGVHVDGGLGEQLVVAAGKALPIGDLPAALGAFVEPTAVAVHALERARLEAGEPVVVLGGGPIGQATALAARARGARVLLSEPVERRRRQALAFGVEGAVDPLQGDLAAEARAFAGAGGVPVVIDTTGLPAGLAGAVAMVASAGRVVVVGISDADATVPLEPFTSKEFDLLGSSCHDRADVEAAVEVVAGAAERLESALGPEFALAEAGAAMAFAGEHPEAAMKVLVRVTG